MPKPVDFRDCGAMKTICLALDRDHDLNLPIGAVLRLKAMVDEDDGQIVGYWVIDDATGEPLDLVSPECVRITRE